MGPRSPTAEELMHDAGYPSNWMPGTSSRCRGRPSTWFRRPGVGIMKSQHGQSPQMPLVVRSNPAHRLRERREPAAARAVARRGQTAIRLARRTRSLVMQSLIESLLLAIAGAVDWPRRAPRSCSSRLSATSVPADQHAAVADEPGFAAGLAVITGIVAAPHPRGLRPAPIPSTRSAAPAAAPATGPPPRAKPYLSYRPRCRWCS